MSASTSDDCKYALAHEIQLVMNASGNMYQTSAALAQWKIILCMQVIPAGHIFLQRLIDLSTTETHLHHLIEAKLHLV